MSGPNRGWGSDLAAGRPMHELSVPINMKMELWLAVIEALEETSINTREIAEAYEFILRTAQRVAAAAECCKPATIEELQSALSQNF